MSRRMHRDEWRAFLSEGTRTGKLATTARPHVAVPGEVVVRVTLTPVTAIDEVAS